MTDRSNRGQDVKLGGGWLELAVVLLGCSVLTICLTYPLAFRMGTIGRTDSSDGQFSVWNVAWVARTLVVDPIHVFDANIFFPHRWTLLYSEANLGAGALAIPAYWMTRNPYVANNFATLLSFVLSAIGSYYLVRYLTQDRRAGVLSAVCFAFCPYVFAHLPHIQLLMTAGLPFSMLAFHRLVDRPTVGRAILLGLTMAVQALFCGYYGLFVMLMIGFSVVLVATTRRLWRSWNYWCAIVTAAAVAVAVALPLLLLYLRLQQTTGFVRTLGAGRQFSANWQAYFASSAYAHAWMLRLISDWREAAFPGFVATVLGISGFVSAWSDRGRSRELALLYGGLGVLACCVSFGPDAGLYTVLYRTVPGFTLVRGASRFCVVVVFALSTLAGVSIARILRDVRRPMLLSLAVTLAAAGELAVPSPFRPVPRLETAYRVLARLPRGAILELPVYSRQFGIQRSRYMLASTAHWMPLVDAYSDHIPEDLNGHLDTLGDFPNRDAFALLARVGARYAVFHLDQYGPTATRHLHGELNEFAPYLRNLWSDDHISLYEIVAFPP